MTRRKRMLKDLDQQIRDHIEQETEDNLERGMSRGEARYAALRRFGNITLAKEDARAVWTPVWLDRLFQDLRYGLRTLRRNPGFTAVVIFTLALGIGMNTAIFSVVNAVLLQPLPYRDSDGLVRIIENVPAGESFSGRPERLAAMALSDFVEWRTRTTTLSHMAIYAPTSMTLTGREAAIRFTGSRVSPALFPLLGAQTLFGRVFDMSADRQGADAVIVLSYGAWQKYWAADPTIVSRPLMLDGKAYSVIGVMRRDFEFPDRQTEFWTPFIPADARAIRVGMVARLHDGVSLEVASTEADMIGRTLRGAPLSVTPSSSPRRFEVITVKDQLVAPARSALVVLTVAVGFVLLIACANVANLLLARTVSRQQEMAIRAALGAGRSRLVRQVLTESLVLALAGGAAATAFAFGGVQLLKALATVNAPKWLESGNSMILPRIDQIRIDGSVLAFTLAASFFTSLLFGVAPALHLFRVDQRKFAKNAPISAAARHGLFGRIRTTSLLVVAEVGLATVLLVAAGLLMRSFIKLSNVDTGYDPHNVLTFQVVLPLSRSADNQKEWAVAEDLVTRLRSLPKIQAAGFTNMLPLTPASWVFTFGIPGLPPLPRGQLPQTRYVSRDYLRAMGVPLLEGRWFGEQDGAGQPRVLLINRALARRYFPDKNPVGTVVTALGNNVWTVVGIVEDVRQRSLDIDPDPQFFIDSRQLPSVTINPFGVSFAVRTDGDPISMVSSIRGITQQLEPLAALDSIAGMEQLVSNSVARPRFFAVLLGIFAIVAGVLAAIGIYGVLAYAVTLRTREIGIRMALGAQPRQVLWLVLGQGAVLTTTGILLGLGGAVGLTRYLATMLFGLTPLDPSTFVSVSFAFALIASLASYAPARRATIIDPLNALRHE